MNSSFNEFTRAISEGSEDFFRDFVEEMPGGFFVYRADESEEVLFLNRAALSIFGCSTAEEFKALTGNTFRGMVHPDDVEDVEKSIERQIADTKDNTDYVEYRIKQKDGSTRMIADYGRYISTDKLGDIFYVFIADDTERMKRRMERLEKANDTLLRLSAREGQYRKAILYDALFFYEVSLTDDKIITAVAQAHGEGVYPVSEILNDKSELDGTRYGDFVRRASKLIDPGELAEYLDFFDRERLIKCCENGELEQTYDRRVTDKLGGTRLMHYVVLLGKSTADGETGALILVKDVTEQNQRRRLLRESLQQAQAAAIAKSTFLSNMSHDIKTPLNAILGFVDLIKLHLGDKDKTEEYLEKIRVSGNQLLTIASEALEVTRMESGKAVLAETDGDLGEMLDDIGKTVFPEMRARQLCFTLDKSPISHPAVLADFTRIKEILVQLLDNAAKYTDRGGRVTLRAEEQPQTDGYGKYGFIVEDNGSGISEEFMERLFEPFARENNTTKSGVPGSGLGMTVVKSLVDLMDGDISVESAVGAGSRFTVTVVLKQTENGAASPAKTGRPVSLKGKRILLVEDNEINSEIAEALLTEEGFLVEAAPDGDVAVETIKNADAGYFDLVLMDIQMPRMNGYDATRAIRALDSRRADIPIIALSANTYAEDRKRSIESGMDAHAPKPIDMAQLLALITTVLEHKPQII